MHFDSKEDYIVWATTILFAQSDKTNNNAIGNAFEHANKLATLFFSKKTAEQTPVPQFAQFNQPPSIANKPPPAPGERAVPTEASGPQG